MSVTFIQQILNHDVLSSASLYACNLVHAFRQPELFQPISQYTITTPPLPAYSDLSAPGHHTTAKPASPSHEEAWKRRIVNSIRRFCAYLAAQWRGMKKLVCSVIVPTYNEEDNIEQLLLSITETFSEIENVACEIFVVDDSSSDRTAERVLAHGSPSVHLLQRPSKMGIGSAYRFAFPKTSGDLIAVMDADFSHDPHALKDMIAAHDKSQTMAVLSSRYMKGGRVVGWSTTRKLVSAVANTLARVLLRIPNSDVTSSFRVYSRDVFKAICEQSTANGFAFQVEAAFWCRMMHVKTTEVPITFRDRTSGQSKFNVTEITAFLILLLRCLIAMFSTTKLDPHN